ncbi:MAG: hypothetical protein ACR2QK_08210 [Acidimicrobiales bacterium]
MSRTFRASELWLIAGLIVAPAAAIWIVGFVVGSSLLQFVGFMTAATTFLPLPADAYVLNTAATHGPLTVAIIGGAVNAVVVLVEREWILRMAQHPIFDRFSEFIGTNRWVDMAERHLFVGLVVGGLSFLPFEPFRLVAVLRGYEPGRYALATFIGRGIRYYWLARVGALFAVYGAVRYVVWASLIIFTIGLLRSYLRYRAVVEDGKPAGSG